MNRLDQARQAYQAAVEAEAARIIEEESLPPWRAMEIARELVAKERRREAEERAVTHRARTQPALLEACKAAERALTIHAYIPGEGDRCGRCGEDLRDGAHLRHDETGVQVRGEAYRLIRGAIAEAEEGA